MAKLKKLFVSPVTILEDPGKKRGLFVYCNVPTFSDRLVWANSIDPGQTGSTLIAIPSASSLFLWGGGAVMVTHESCTASMYTVRKLNIRTQEIFAVIILKV